MASMLSLLVLMSIATYTLPLTLSRQRQTDLRFHERHQETLIESGRKCKLNLEKQRLRCMHKNLTSVPDIFPSNIEIFELQYNLIPILLNSSFERYTQLISLNVCGNRIKHIETGTFTELIYLQRLDLSDNCIEHIETGTFTALIHLQRLDLGSNDGIQLINPNGIHLSQSLTYLSLVSCDIKSLPTDILRWFPQLKIILLSINIISHINFTCTPSRKEQIEVISLMFNDIRVLAPETLKLDCKVYQLDLRYNPLTDIAPDVFYSLRVQSLLLAGLEFIQDIGNNLFNGIAKSRIKHLGIRKTQLASTPHLFDPLHNYPLVILDLFRNELPMMNNYTFSNLNLVRELHLADNNIKLIEPECFFGMKLLQVLWLNDNGIYKINPFHSTWKTNMSELYLSYNNLQEIREETFRGLHNLSVLDLAFNKHLTILIISHATGLNNLRLLDVTGSNLGSLSLNAPLLRSIILSSSVHFFGFVWSPGETFAHTPSLERLYLNNSCVYSGKIWNNETKKSLFDGLSNATMISLSHNPIVSLVPGMFRGLHTLEYLNLSFCQISKIDSDALHGLSALQTLILSHNEIQQLPGHLLSDLKALHSFNIMGNKVNYLGSEFFAENTIMKELIFSKNQFAAFNQSTFSPLYKTLTSVDISQNPLVCNCEMAWFCKWLKGSVQVIKQSQSLCAMSSATLKPVRGKPVLTFDPEELCGPDIGLICSIPLAAVGLFALIFFVHRYRWFVRYKFFLLKLAVVGYVEVVDARDHGDFEYDLNIMFMEDDKEWVEEHLRPVLEERLPNFNRNVFGDDDLIPGMHYFDAVYHVIEKSFKTVILLSRAAFQDNWFMIKFRIAFEQVNDARLENVVVVFLEDIADAELPYLVRLYLSDRRTYLWWMEDERGQEYFWNELLLTLQKDNVKWNNMIPPE